MTSKKIAVLITGAAGGLGKSCVDMAQGLDVDVIIATDIALPLYLSSKDKEILCFEMDVSSEASINTVKSILKEKGIHIKYLINNAGVFDYFPISEANEALLNKTLKVNTYGPILTVNTFLDDLIQTKGRVVQISSVSVKLPLLFMPYPNSKIALEAFSTSMRQELSLHGVKLITIRPGAMDTNLISGMKSIQNPIKESRYKSSFDNFTKMAQKDVGKMVHPDRVAKLIHKALVSKNPKLIYSINKNLKIGFMLLFPLRLKDFLITKFVTTKK